eukprot:Ihof_evm1s816 gene=Ihof_evmTU1s816
MPQYFHKPENALKRAKELIEVGKKSSALEALHDVIASKRHRNWTKTSEQILLLFLDLCVEMRKGKTAKDGLHQYKGMCQQIAIGSLETVIRKFVSLSESKAEEARALATASTSTTENVDGGVEIDDLEATETPESLILATVTGEGNQDRTDREILTPWLKFLWETYRTVLEILRNNPKLESLYQEIAQHAFQFCLKYTRKTEFRRLCDLLRTHLSNVQKYTNQTNTINLNNPDSLQLHLETRFAQLEAAAKLDLWQEAFRTIEDIHGLMGMSKKPPKPQMMATYFEQLALVFWKSDNYLFHAYSWHKLFWLTREQKKNLTAEEATQLATHCVLATLLIPVSAVQDNEQYLGTNSLQVKQQQQAMLVGLSKPPSRASLINDLRTKNVLQHVPSEVSQLFTWLEEEFHPLQLCKKVAPVLEWMTQREDLAAYVTPLKTVALIRLLQQVSKVYQIMKIDALCQLVTFASRFEIEKLLVDAVRTKIIHVRLNHRSGTISFGADMFFTSETVEEGIETHSQAMHSEHMLDILTTLSKGLFKISAFSNNNAAKEKKERAMLALAKLVESEHRRTLERKVIIEKRKIMLEESITRKNKLQAATIAQQKALAKQQEQIRLEAESRKRIISQQKREKEEMEKAIAMEKVVAMKKAMPSSKLLASVKMEELVDMDPEAILAKQVQQLEKEKKELLARLKMVERKNDHFERAKRLEELPKLAAEREKNRVEDRRFHQEAHLQAVARARQQHAKDLAQKERLAKMAEDQALFVDEIKKLHQADLDKRMAEFRVYCDSMLAQRKEERRERKRREEQERIEQERFEREEEARRLEEERLEREAEEARKHAEEQMRIEKERLAEIARLQAEKEREVEQKLQMARMEKLEAERAARNERMSSERPSRPSGEPSPAAPTGSWRDKQTTPTEVSAGARRWNIARTESPREREREEAPPMRGDRDRAERFGSREAPSQGAMWGRRETPDRDRERMPMRERDDRERMFSRRDQPPAAPTGSWRTREAAREPE